HAGEVLQQDARRRERNLFLRAALHVPPRQRLDIPALDEPAILVAQQILEQNLQRVRQPRDFSKTAGGKRRQAEEIVATPAGFERLSGIERVGVSGRHQVLEENSI